MFLQDGDSYQSRGSFLYLRITSLNGTEVSHKLQCQKDNKYRAELGVAMNLHWHTWLQQNNWYLMSM